MEIHDGRTLEVRPAQWLQVTPDPELLSMIMSDRGNEELYRTVIGDLSERSAERVWDAVLADMGEGWNDFAVSQTLWRRRDEAFLEMGLASPREEVRSTAYSIVADALVPDGAGHEIPYSRTPEGIERLARVIETDPSPVVVGSVIAEYTRSQEVPGRPDEWIHHPDFPPRIREAISGVLPRLRKTDPHLGDNRSLMFHIEEAMKSHEMDEDLLPDYLAAGNRYNWWDSGKWSHAEESLGRLYHRDPEAYERILGRLSDADRLTIMSEGRRRPHRSTMSDPMMVDLHRRGVSEGWLEPRGLPPAWVEKIWPRDGSFGVPPWMEPE